MIFQGRFEKLRCGNLCSCKANISRSNSFRDMIIFPFGTSSITSLRMYTKELYVLEKNNHISENVLVTKVYLTFSQISKSQLFRATLKLNFICLFLSFIASQKITLHVDTPCMNLLSSLF